jgi:hypothetical protein
MMGSKWSEAQAVLASFLHSDAVKADPEKQKLLIEVEKEAVHLFSLLHAIALTSLSQTSGQVYGRISPEGAQHFRSFRSVPRTTLLADLQNVIDGAEDLMAFGDRSHWPSRLVIVGEVTEKEALALSKTRRQVDIAYSWVLDLVTRVVNDKLVTIPPPIYGRVYAELSAGNNAYCQAECIASITFPDVLTRTAFFNILSVIIVIPIIIERFTASLILTPVLTFLSVFGFLMVHGIAIQLEAPFGEDYIDVPLLEMHAAYLSKLTSVADVEFGDAKETPAKDAKPTETQGPQGSSKDPNHLV